MSNWATTALAERTRQSPSQDSCVAARSRVVPTKQCHPGLVRLRRGLIPAGPCRADARPANSAGTARNPPRNGAREGLAPTLLSGERALFGRAEQVRQRRLQVGETKLETHFLQVFRNCTLASQKHQFGHIPEYEA